MSNASGVIIRCRGMRAPKNSSAAATGVKWNGPRFFGLRNEAGS